MYATFEQQCIARANQYDLLEQCKSTIENNGHDQAAVADVLLTLIQIMMEKHTQE